ncbi:hypothetical protein [Thalassobacillus sp. C254]|nr:hypothetical protein [Thalassobacillus sp. C254]
MELLKEIKSTAHHASIKADDAEDAANAALQLAQQNKKDFERYQKRQDAEKKWTIKTGLTIIGFIVTLTAAMVPIFFSFYF